MARIAGRSHGVVTRAELLAAGISRSEIEHRLGTGSRLERGFRTQLKGDDLELPITNRPAAHYVDCRWPGHYLIVELDSYRFHKTRHAWEQDRRRDREARRRAKKCAATPGATSSKNPRRCAELRELLR